MLYSVVHEKCTGEGMYSLIYGARPQTLARKFYSICEERAEPYIEEDEEVDFSELDFLISGEPLTASDLEEAYFELSDTTVTASKVFRSISDLSDYIAKITLDEYDIPDGFAPTKKNLENLNSDIMQLYHNPFKMLVLHKKIPTE